MDIFLGAFLSCWCITAIVWLYFWAKKAMKNRRINKLHPIKWSVYAPETLEYDDLINSTYKVLDGVWLNVSYENALRLLNAMDLMLADEKAKYEKDLVEMSGCVGHVATLRIYRLKPLIEDLKAFIGERY